MPLLDPAEFATGALAGGTAGLLASGGRAGQGAELPGKAEADLGGRHLIGWTWQNDPLFRIRYRYA